MSLINPAILFGMGFIAIPIVLHFLLRQKPKKLLFPALRLIQVRQKNNVRRMRLRHLWLLLLRVLVIVFLVFALARPSLPAADYGLSGRETLALAVIVGVAVAAYFLTMRWWRSQRIAQHDLSYKRSLLRGGTGVGAALLLLLLVIWPYWRRIQAELSAPQQQVKENVPVSAVFLFDTSASMEYRLESKTRLERAQELSVDFLEKLPPRSRVSVADTTSDAPALFQADLTSARGRIRALKPSPVSLPMNSRLRAALLTQEDDRRRTLELESNIPVELRQDRMTREIYVFTDMSRSAWKPEDARLLHAEMERHPWVSVYLIDVGVKKPANIGISGLRLSRQTVTEGGPITVEATLEAVGVESAARTVEIYLNSGAGGLAKKGQSTVTVDTQGGARVAFTLPGVKGPIVQGEVRLVASDPLAIDDVRYFTAVVKPIPEILLVGQNPEEAVYWREALAPSEWVRLGKARYRCDYVDAARLDSVDFRKYDSVCLFNLQRPSANAWDKLAKYVADGGGLSIFLGSTRIDPVAYNSAGAQSFLPAELIAHLRFRDDVFLDMKNVAHPILQKFEDLGGPGELTSAPIFRYWKVKPNDGATVAIAYTDDTGAPALADRPHGQGRTLLWTTGVDLSGWSELPLAPLFVALADQTMQYLARAGEGVYNYEAGEAVILPVERRRPVRQYLLRKPGLEQLPGEAPPDAQPIAIDGSDQAGQYEVVSAEKGVDFASGFSVNVPAAESDFSRIVEADLDVLLGEKRYRIADDLGTLERVVSTGRLGQEMFPFVLAFLLAAFVAEHLAANFFYEAEQAPLHR